MNLTYKGVDITDDVNILRCYHEMNAEGRADNLRIEFDDNDNLWDKWQPATGDELLVKNDGLSSGVMQVTKFIPESGRYVVIASTLPPAAKQKEEKAWQDVRLLQIGEEIAKKHGLRFKSYGIENYRYPYLLQKKESDFHFLSRVCKKEGCAFLIRSKTLILYLKERMESQPEQEIDLSNYGGYRFFDNSHREYGSCEIVCGNHKGKVIKNNKPVFIPNDVFVCNTAEAVRYAKNLLVYANQDIYTGYMRQEEITNLTAGAVAKINGNADESWNKRVLITKIRNEYAAQKSKIFFRRIND